MVLVGQARHYLRSRPLILGLTAAAAATVVLGIPTGVIANPVFERKVPVQGFEIGVLAALSVITGTFAATYGRPTNPDATLRRTGITTGVVGWFAISCPLCNPIVLALLGASGATGLFARLQPAIGALAVALAASALVLRLRALRRGTCRIDAGAPRPSGSASGMRTAQPGRRRDQQLLGDHETATNSATTRASSSSSRT